MTSPIAISTFSGEGSSIGYKQVGFDVRVAFDCAPEGFTDEILTTFRANHPERTLLNRDAREISGDELLEAADCAVGEVDLLDGSPPCSPFSAGNTQRDWRAPESGTLFDEYVRFVDEIKPRAFVAENVP